MGLYHEIEFLLTGEDSSRYEKKPQLAFKQC